jgi:hypothetical protein
MLPAAEGNGATEADDLAPDSLLDTGLGSLRLSAGHHSQVVPHRLGVHAGGRWQVSIPTAATAHREIKRGRFVKAKRTYRVTVTRQRDYSATISIRAGSQAEADRKALAAFYKYAFPPRILALERN